MTLAVWNGTAADESSGDLTVLVSPTVTVTDKATGAKPSLFSDRAGNTGIGNPFTAGADGSIEFYVAPGRYKIVADDGSGNTATWDNQLIGAVHGADKAGLAVPGTSSDPLLALDTWRTPNANRPTLVLVDARVRNSTSSNGIISILADESGGTSIDYNFNVAFSSSDNSDSTAIDSSTSFLVPAGGAYQVENTSDPKGNNSILEHREFTL